MKVFCDLDGTLIDVAPRHYVVYKAAVERCGGSPLQIDEYWEMKRSKTSWSVILPRSNVAIEKKSIFLNYFIQDIEGEDLLRRDKLLPGARSSLEYLGSKHDLFLVSLRRNREHLQNQVEHLGIATYFAAVLSGHSENDGSDVKSELIQAVLAGDEGVIIGDTEADILAGKEIGLTSYAVLSGIRSRQALEPLQPDYLLNGIHQIKEFL